MDELDALDRVAQMRAILANAGRRDLADLAWSQLCPRGVPVQVRYDALRMAGYPFPAPEAAPRPPLSLAQQRARTRAILAGQTVPPLPGAPRIVALPADETDPETARLYADERADYRED